MEENRQYMKIIFSIILLVAGVIINTFIPTKQFFGYSSVGTYLIFCGILILALALLRGFILKPKNVDERMINIALKATRLTFVIFMLSAFVIMIIDGIKPIIMPYSIFMSYFVCAILLVYIATYKIMLKYY
jgi:uncharacterized membrane protein